MKKVIDELYKFGENLAEAVAKHLREFAKKQGYSKNKNFDMNAIKYDPINGFDVQVSEYQSGECDDVIIEWEKNNPGKDYYEDGDDTVNNDYYYELLDEGESYTKDVFDKMNKDGKYSLGVGTGDGDEGHVYIDITLSSKYKSEVENRIKELYKEDIDKILDKYKK